MKAKMCPKCSLIYQCWRKCCPVCWETCYRVAELSPEYFVEYISKEVINDNQIILVKKPP